MLICSRLCLGMALPTRDRYYGTGRMLKTQSNKLLCAVWSDSAPSIPRGPSKAGGSQSQDHHEILRLLYFADLSYQEMAEALSIAPGTVMSRLYLARKALATMIPGEEQ
jgi:hypothetical protein